MPYNGVNTGPIVTLQPSILGAWPVGVPVAEGVVWAVLRIQVHGVACGNMSALLWRVIVIILVLLCWPIRSIIPAVLT